MTHVTFWQSFKAVYADSVAFVRACWLLALVPVVFELLQHVVEVRLGMYASLAAAQASEDSPLRTAFGLLKVASLTLPIYWVMRFLARRDARFAARLEAPAWRLFAVFFVVQVALGAVDLYLLPRHGWWAGVLFVVGMVEGALFAAWAVGASLGNERMGVVDSVRLMARRLPWTLAFQIAVILPLMVPHYALGLFAIVGPKTLMWPTLVLDALLVGYLAPVIVAGSYFPALRAAQLAGEPLFDGDGTALEPVAA